MILTCPQCDTRFVVPSTIFMRGGRKVRCSSCKHDWFQDEPLEKAEGANFAATLKNNDDEVTDRDDQKILLLDKIKHDFTNGYKVIAGVCCIVILGFFAYRMMMTPLVMGQGLAFDNVSIDRQGDELIVTGDIVNAMDGDRGVPSIQITKILANDIAGDTIIIAPAKEILSSGESISLSATIENVGNVVRNLKVTFKSDKPVEESSDDVEADSQQSGEDYGDDG